MSKQTCNMIHDLLPLYADGVCSEESRKIVNEHLASCSECSDMLHKMNRKVAIAAETDISAVKKIKKRVFLGKLILAIAAVVLSLITLICGYFFAVTDCSMDYEKYNLAENVWVEEDSEGQLWFCMKDNAAALSAFAYPTVSDTDGGHMGYKNQTFNREKKAGFGYTLRMLRISKIAPFDYPQKELRFPISRDIKDIKYIFYYDDVNNQEYVLWGEKPQ